MKRALTILLPIAVVLTPLALVLDSVTAQAGDDVGIIVSPPYFTEQVDNGNQVTQTFKVINQRATDESIVIFSKEVGYDENGEVYIKDGYDPNGPSLFEKQGILSFSPQEFFLEKGESQDVDVTLDLPNDTDTSGIYLELAVTVSAKPGLESIGVVPEIAIPILLNNIGDQGSSKEPRDPIL